MNAVDEWWNRAFPAHSPRRLLFFLTAYPLIGLLVEAGMGVLFRQLPDDFGVGLLHGGFSWLRYSVLTLSGMALIAFLWFSGTLHGTTAAPPREPRRDHEPLHAYRPSWADFATGLPFGIACVLLLLWAIEEPFTPITVAVSVAGGVLVSACVVLRNTIWAPILVSLAGGAVIGLFLMLLSMFMSGPQGFLANWAIGSLIVAAFMVPTWHAQCASLASRIDLPIWVLMGGMVILVAGAAVLIRSAA
jgi:hypothetical protein